MMSTPDQAYLELKDVSVGYKAYGRRPNVILSHVSANLRSGRIVGLVGPNGAGKSTLLRSIANLQPLLRGEVFLGGESTRHLSQRQIARKMAVVLTDRVQVNKLRVRDVVAIGRHPHSGLTGRLTDEDERIVQESLETVGAGALAMADIGELSDGQRQRVMVARALAQQPRVMLLDEPTAFLDPPGRIALLRLLRRVCSTQGIAGLVCTHDIETVLRYADELWLVGRREELTVGGPEDLAADGRLAGAFGGEGVTFKLETLSFWADEPDAPLSSVVGADGRAQLARNALYRAGFIDVPDDDPRPHLRVETQGDQWVLDIGTRESFDSLAALNTRVRQLAAR